MWWRVALGLGIVGLTLLAFLADDTIGSKGRGLIGVVCFIAVPAVFSSNLRAVRWRTVVVGFALQFLLVLFILQWSIKGPFRLEAFGRVFLEVEEGKTFQPGFEMFRAVGEAIGQFLKFSDEGAKFVFGKLADDEAMEKVHGKGNGFVFAFRALPPIIFVSSFFTVLYYFGVLQWIVRVLARVMMRLMGTSGAETLSATANVFMGQTEAPLIVKPYVRRMTESELLALMVGGMATISGGIMAVYIQMGADKVAILATSVMAAPCGLYLSKLLLPETGQPETSGQVKVSEEQPHRNVIDAAAAGASDGLSLALNVAAMLIAFIALLALVDFLLGLLPIGQSLRAAWSAENTGVLVRNIVTSLALAWFLGWVVIKLAELFAPGVLGRWRPLGLLLATGLMLVLLFAVLETRSKPMSLQTIFSWVFSPVALLMGVPLKDVPAVADLLGTKLTANEFVAYLKLTSADPQLGVGLVPDTRAYILATYALTGFANFASIGIQLGGIGAMAPERRPDLARLGMRALLAGFLATLVNASLAGLFLKV